MAGLIDLERYRADPTFRSLRRRGALRPARPAAEPVGAGAEGVWPGIGPDDTVLLWAGGVWRWLDAHHADPGGGAAARRRPARAPGVPGHGPAGARPARRADQRRRGDRIRRASAGWRARACTSTAAGCRTRSARLTCSSPTSASAPITTTSRPASPSGPACSTTSGQACPRSCPAATRSATWWTAAGSARRCAPEDDEAYAAACAGLLDDREAHAAAVDGSGARAVAPLDRVARPLVRFCLEHATRPRRRVPTGRAGARHLRPVPRRPDGGARGPRRGRNSPPDESPRGPGGAPPCVSPCASRPSSLASGWPCSYLRRGYSPAGAGARS